MTSQYFTLEGYQSQTGTTLKQYQFQGGENQQFKLEAFGEYFYLVPIYCDNMALAVNAEGTGVVLQPKSVIDMSQQFGIRSQLNGAYRIIPRLDASKSIAQMSENVSVYEGLSVCDYTGEPWQEWRFTMPDDYTVSDAPESGEIYYLHFNHSYRYLTVANEENASVKQETFDSGLDQQFQLKQTTDGYYHIYPMNTTKDMVLSVVPNASRTDGGGELKLQMKTDSAYQEFKFIETPNSTYRMVCRASATEDYCVELTSGSQSTNEEVTYAPFSGTGTANQWLTLEKIGPVIRTSTDYKKGKTNVENIIDEAGYITYMEEFQDGSPAIVRDAKGNWTEHYYSCEKDTLIYASSGSSMVNYSYDEDYALSHIDSASGTTYEFNYDAYRNIQSVAVGSRVLMNYSYENNNGVETSSTYGNGVGNWYMYDLYDRVDYVVYNINSQQGSREVLYDYDAFGRLYRTWDKYRDVYTINEYDFIGRPVRTETTDGLEQTYQYDSQNRITSYSTRVGANSLTTGFVYGDSSVYGNNLQKDGYLYGVTLNGERAISYEFDALSRLVAQRLETANNYKVQYEYYKGPNNEGTAKTTTMLESVVNGDTRWTYTYDEVGNITSVSKNGTVVESYTYDNLNQLKTVTRGTDVWEYSYDNGGNLIEVKKNGSVIKTYAYGDSEWKDLLTAYNGQNLTYDEIGNPLQYRDGMSFIWQNGRKLATVTKGIDNIQYDYDSDGYRVSKSVNGIETKYYWLDGMLLGQECNGEVIMFLYDDAGMPYGMCVKNGTTESYYYYLYNVQGDVIGIIDANGTQVVEYTYSAWGELLFITGSMADSIGQKNPLRYRGYYYDGETGFYYLLSRYYDPEMSRFINADIYISTGQGILGNNMFVYCGNNSVTFVDECGTRYCEATTVINEKGYNRTMACKFQTRVVLEEMDVVVDITQKLNDFMEANVAKLEEYWSEHTTYETCWYFYENVKDGGTLDIKTQEEWKFEKGKKYIYNGMELRFDDPGNINFGYVGFTLFPKVLLCAGAGVNQIFKFAFQFGDVFSFYDDPRDNYMIRYGYDLRRSGF
jgi:RHS repeat-associated protein